MNFDITDAVKAKESGKRIEAGIKDATFKGIEFRQKTIIDKVNNCLAIHLDVDGYGEYIQDFLEPKENERKDGQWGKMASPLDHFLIIVREIFDALDPQIIKDIESGTKKLSSNKFSTLVETIKKYTDPYIGTRVQIKLIPGNKGFISMPSFPAKITRDGNLSIATRIIGHDLTLTSSEIKKIEAAKNAAPTNMGAKASIDTNDLLSSIDSQSTDTDTESDLPF